MSTTEREASTSVPAVPAAPAGEAVSPVSALVIDADAVSRKFVDLALRSQAKFVVEAAVDAAGALETLASRTIDIIVAEIDLKDMNGLQLFRRLSQERRLRNIPFLVLSSDRRPSTKVAALRAGVDDYLTKPVDAAEFVARVTAHVDRQRRLRESLRQRRYTLAGELTALPFTDLVSMLEMGRRSGVLSLVTPSATGQVFFDGGSIVHAVYANVTGADAFYQLVAETEGTFEFSPGQPALAARDRTIVDSAMALIMEGARRFDHERATNPASSPVPSRPATIPPPDLKPALVPEATLGGLFQLAVADAFALGELRLWTHDELSRWTLSDGSRDRMHVTLVADLPEGVSAILALGGAPTERWIMGSLRPEPKVFGLSFFFRHERMLDVVLVDAQDPGAVEASLRRVPTFQIVAPPDGDFYSLGVNARVALERMIQKLRPPAVVGVGNDSLDAALQDVVRDARGTVTRSVRGRLGDRGCDLRSLLLKGIALWTASDALRGGPQ